MGRDGRLGRRAWARLLAGIALAPRGVAAQSARRTLTLGVNIVDTVTLDPARQANYTPPLTLAACYDTLVTLAPDQYDRPVPLLATGWESLADAPGWRFTLRPDATFASGAPVTAADWQFSLERLLALGDEPAQFLAGIASVAAPDPGSLEIRLRQPDGPLLGVLASPSFAVLERRAVEAQGGTALPNARQADRATIWLNQRSAGSGPYVLSGWARNQSIQLEANPRWWGGRPGYDRIVIRHMPDSTAQGRALQRGDIDAAFNLLPEQVATFQSDAALRVESTTSLDFVYLALNGGAALNPALARREARQAIAAAIDYDDLIGRMLGGKAVRPASFLPIGVSGSTPEIARAIGPKQDLDLARALLAQAALPNGFGFELSYSDTAIAGLLYGTLARKLKKDLARVGIEAQLRAQDPATVRARFFGGQAQAALAFWNAPVIDTRLWAEATIERLAQRVDFEPPAALARFVDEAARESDPERQRALWVEYQKAMIYRANLITLFQPVYQVAVQRRVAALPLTAAGWMAELRAARPG